MLEARAFVPEIETTRQTLEDAGARYKGEYICKDYVYSPVDPVKDLADEFLRLRVNVKNIWAEKDVVVALKRTERKVIGKNSLIPFRKEFDSEAEARGYIEDNFFEEFRFEFVFTRTGWQYDLGQDQVDLERVEEIPNCYTIEVKSATEAGLQKLTSFFGVASVIRGPSVVEVKRLLSQSGT